MVSPRVVGQAQAMVVLSKSVHPNSLPWQEAAKAWYLRMQENWTWHDIVAEVKNLRGETPSERCVRETVARMGETPAGALPEYNYQNCGRRWGADGQKNLLSPSQACGRIKYVTTKKIKAVKTLLFGPTAFPLRTGAKKKGTSKNDAPEHRKQKPSYQ